MTSTGAAFAIKVSNMGQHRHPLQASHLVLQQTPTVAVGDLRSGTHNVRTAVALSLTVSQGSSARSAGCLFTNGVSRLTGIDADLILAAAVTTSLQFQQVMNSVVELALMSPFPANFAAPSPRWHATIAAPGTAIIISSAQKACEKVTCLMSPAANSAVKDFRVDYHG